MSTLYSPSVPLLESDLTDGTAPDPIRLVLLDLFRAALINRFSLTWDTMTAGTPLVNTASAVVDFYPGALTTELLTERKCEFPLLLVDRVGTVEYAEESLELEKTTQPWDLNWVLGPLRTGELHRFRAALTKLVPDLVRDICSGGGVHPSYNSGNSVFGPGGIPVGSMRLANHNADSLTIQGKGEERLYHGVTCRLETTEYDTDSADNYPDFLTADISVAVGGFEGLVPDFIKRTVNVGTG